MAQDTIALFASVQIWYHDAPIGLKSRSLTPEPTLAPNGHRLYEIARSLPWALAWQ